MQRRIQVWLGSALVIGTAAAPAMAQCPLQTSAEAECVVLEREASSTPMTADLACSPSIQSAVQDFKESWRVRTADRARVDDWLAAPDKHLFGLVTAWQRAASTASSASNDPEASVEGEVRVEVGAGVEDIAALWSGAGPGDEEDIGTLGLNTSVQTAASASDILLAYEGQAAVGGCSAGSGGTGTGGGPGGPLGGGPALTPGAQSCRAVASVGRAWARHPPGDWSRSMQRASPMPVSAGDPPTPSREPSRA